MQRYYDYVKAQGGDGIETGGGNVERKQAEAVMEAILFTMGDSVEVARLAEVIGEDVAQTREILA